MHRPLLLRDRPEFPFYTTSTPEAAYTQWPLCQKTIAPMAAMESFIKSQVLRKLAALLNRARESRKRPILLPEFPIFYAFQAPPRSNDELLLEDSIIERLDRLPFTRSIAALERLYDDIFVLGNMADRRLGIIRFRPEVPYPEDVRRVQERIDELVPAIFHRPVQPPIEPEVHGYRMPHYASEVRMDHGLYHASYVEWHRKDQLSPERLKNWLDDACCSDWSKMDVHGEYYGGFWAYPEGSVERENAWDLTRETNLNALCTLPYPSRAIMYFVRQGCNNRKESVAYVVFCCELLRRKMEQMKDTPFHTYMAEEEDDMRP